MQMKEDIKDLKSQNEKKSTEEVEERIANLKPELQETVRACFQSGRAKGPQGQRSIFKYE
jgi:hypothetical protein